MKTRTPRPPRPARRSANRTDSPRWQNVEVQILHSVYDKAKNRATSDGETMASIGRRIIMAAAQPDDLTDLHEHLTRMGEADRPNDADRFRYRYRCPWITYQRAAANLDNFAATLIDEDRSLARWIEYKLELYAATGRI